MRKESIYYKKVLLWLTGAKNTQSKVEMKRLDFWCKESKHTFLVLTRQPAVTECLWHAVTRVVKKITGFKGTVGIHTKDTGVVNIRVGVCWSDTVVHCSIPGGLRPVDAISSGCLEFSLCSPSVFSALACQPLSQSPCTWSFPPTKPSCHLSCPVVSPSRSLCTTLWEEKAGFWRWRTKKMFLEVIHTTSLQCFSHCGLVKVTTFPQCSN